MTWFSAADPDRIKDFLEHKEQDLAREKKLVDELLPTLLLKYQKTKEQVDVEVFYGWEGMTTVYNDIVKTLGKGDEDYVFGASMGLQSKQADIFYSQYMKKIEKKGYSLKIIFNENVRGYKERVEYFEKSPLHEVRYLHHDTFTELNLYKDTVLVIMLIKDPIVIRIRSKDAANSFRKFFNTMWDIAKE